tara:strand:+ start:1998 stop:2417 length:420 start_codon:yes stop_codon:yes gene_type:complete
MATTATFNLSSDLLSSTTSVSTSSTLMKAGTTADGLDQMDFGYIEIPTGDQYDLFDANNSGLNNSKANKVYIANESTDETYYVTIMIDAQNVGRLYAGDWMFIPWGSLDQHDDIEITSSTGTNKITYALFHEGRTLTAS